MRERLGEINWKLLWAVVSCIVIFIATFAVVLWLRDQDIQRVGRLAESNRVLIQRVDTLNKTQATAAYKECVDRNGRSKESQKLLRALVHAHVKDGDRAASAFWRSYLTKLEKIELPPCKKPDATN